MEFNTETGARWFVISAIIVGVLLGFSVRPSGVHDPAQQPGRHATPTPEPKLSGATGASAYVERSTTCRNPGGTNQAGYCWYEGWAFTRKTICIDSSIAGAPLGTVVSKFTGPGGLRVINGGTKAGNCAAKGYPASQRVSFVSMSKNTAARWGYGACGLTSAANYGNLSSVGVSIYLTGAQRTPCGAGVEWTDVFLHEFGHALGLSHRQPHVSSIMRDGHSPDASDRAKLAQIYTARRA